MSIDFVPERQTENRPRITVFGIGGAGSNAVNNMISGDLGGVEFVVANTDAQSLFQSLCEHRVRLGVNITQGLGAGARADIGKVAAEEALEDIQGYLAGNNMVFIAAGMGGGTGTGAAPVIARAAREHGILTVGVVTKPFHFEGSQRMRVAEQGIQELHQYVDTLIVIPNQNLFSVASEQTTFADAFGMADDVLHAGVRGVTDLMVNPGLINLDFADIRTVMGTMGKAMMGTGEAEGANRSTEAAEAAINNPLLDNASIDGARGVLINITGGTDVTLHEVDAAASRICKDVDQEATIIFGTSLDQKMDGHMRVSVIATGIDANDMRAPIPDSSGNIHVLGFSDRKGSGSGALSGAEAMKETAETAAAPTTDATASDTPDIVIPVAKAAADSAAAAGGAGSPAPAASTAQRPAPSPRTQGAAPTEARAALPEHKAVAASAAGSVAARASVAGAGARVERPAARHGTAWTTAPERPETKVSPTIDRPAPPPRRNNGHDALLPSRPSLFERMTGTGRARRNGADGADGDAPANGAGSRAAESAVAKSRGLQTEGLETRLRPESPSPLSPPPLSPPPLSPPSATAPAPGGDTRKVAAAEPEPYLDGLALSTRAPGGTDDPLDIPAFLRRQAN